MSSKEEIKRLVPRPETLRELYLKSGNRCAFPGCDHVMIDGEGKFVGQICHIEAAEEGGERFNPDQSNEDRRQAANLMLMCYRHHVVTNDVEQYPVDRMRRIKKEHEKIYSDVVGSMLLTVSDHTVHSEPAFAADLKRMDEVLGWGISEDERAASVQELKDVVLLLAKVPRPSREMFEVMVSRSGPGHFGADLQVAISEIQQATGVNTSDLRTCISILDKHGFCEEHPRDDFGNEIAAIPALKSGWPLWVER